jgi:hypothetical protein
VRAEGPLVSDRVVYRLIARGFSMTSQKTWTETTLDNAVNEVVSSGLFDQPILEARPVWHIEGAILIAECRAGATRYWLVAGADSPTDIIPKHREGGSPSFLFKMAACRGAITSWYRPSPARHSD